MRGILCLLDARASKAFQRSRKEKEQVENVKLLLNHSLLPTSLLLLPKLIVFTKKIKPFCCYSERL
ncbi:MAG: hypothetical protein AAF573_23400 [Bacteroidota bacterium]